MCVLYGPHVLRLLRQFSAAYMIHSAQETCIKLAYGLEPQYACDLGEAP